MSKTKTVLVGSARLSIVISLEVSSIHIGLVGAVTKTSLVLWVAAFSMLSMLILLAASFTITGTAPAAKICVLYSKKLCSLITASSSEARSCAHTEPKNSSGSFPNTRLFGFEPASAAAAYLPGFLLNNSLDALAEMLVC